MGLRNRQWVVAGIILFMTVVFLSRLGQIQLADPSWSAYAARLTEERESTDAARGLILDRHGELLVANMASYDLLFTPRTAQIAGLDTAALARLVDLSRPELEKQLDKARKYSRYRPSVIVRSLTGDEYARIAGEIWRYPGVRARRRSVRSNLAGTAGHLIGEYREADADDLAADDWYRLGDFKGKSGLEAIYETELRGKKGVKYHLVDVRNDVRSSVAGGTLDTASVPGGDLTLTIDADLQHYAERLMAGKRGSVVAIEPETGEILAFVSAPTYDPDLLTGTKRGAVYDSLAHHPGKPLFNRASRATYRPGSIFKMVQGLIALDENVISPQTRIICDRNIINCHGAHSFDNLQEAIMHSCNPYFHEVMKRFVERRTVSSKFEDAALGLGNWTERIKGFGFGTDLGGHIPGARAGLVPDTAYYDNIYERRSWAYSTIYSISIGEGELLVTPLQIANVAAIVANRGSYRTPHAVRDIGGRGKPAGIDSLIFTGIEPELFDPVVNAMQTVVEQPGGTARRARVPGLEICGKTGTVQDDPRLEHSVFMAFAPKDNPQIAISVYVENAGAGGKWAAPIASLLIEQYLNDTLHDPEREARILAAHDPFPDER